MQTTDQVRQGLCAAGPVGSQDRAEGGQEGADGQLRLIFDELKLVDRGWWKATATRAEGGFGEELGRLAMTGVIFFGARWEDGVEGGSVRMYSLKGSIWECFCSNKKPVSPRPPLRECRKVFPPAAYQARLSAEFVSSPISFGASINSPNRQSETDRELEAHWRERCNVEGGDGLEAK